MLPVVAAACLALAAPAPKSDLAAAAARYSELTAFPRPKDALPGYNLRVAQLEAMVTFLKKNVDVYLSGAVSQGELEGFTANVLQANRDLFQILQRLDFPAGMAESYRIQAGLTDAVLREVRLANGFRPSHGTAIRSAADDLAGLYEKAAEVKPPAAK